MMLNKSMKTVVCSPDGESDFFDIGHWNLDKIDIDTISFLFKKIRPLPYFLKIKMHQPLLLYSKSPHIFFWFKNLRPFLFDW